MRVPIGIFVILSTKYNVMYGMSVQSHHHNNKHFVITMQKSHL